MKHNLRFRQLLGACSVMLAIMSLLLAPQAGMLADMAPAVPLLPAFSLNLFLAVVAGVLWLRLLQNLPGLRACRGLPLAVALAHLPLMTLWWPALVGRTGGWPRLWVPVAVALTASLIVVAAGFVHRMWRLATVLGIVVVVAGVTARSLVTRPIDCYFLASAAALWGVVLMVSMIGWGAGLFRLMLPDADFDCGQKMALGLACAVAVGGLLNLVWAVSHTLVLVFVGTGCLFCLANMKWRRLLARERLVSLHRAVGDPVAVLLTVVVAGLLGLQYAGAIAGTVDTVNDTPVFDLHDDCQAYLAFPEKMLQRGSLGPEPFEARRMLSMGGQSFLQTLVLVVLPLRTLHLLDAGIAMVALVLLVAGGARRWGLGRLATLLVLLVTLAHPHAAMRGNTSALLTGTVLLVAWYRLLSENVLTVRPSIRNATLIAMHVAGLCALKSTLIPAAAVLFAVSAVITVARSSDRPRQLREVWATGLMIVLLLLPWMVSIYCSSATLLYPIFGTGFYGGGKAQDLAALVADVGPFETVAADVLLALRSCAAPLVPLLMLLFVPKIGKRGATVAIASAAILTVVLLVLMGDPHLMRSLSRYAFPVVTAGVLVLLLRCMRARPATDTAFASPAAVAAALVGLSLLLVVWDVADVYRRTLLGIEAAAAGLPVVAEHDQRAMAEMERTLPPGATVLETLTHPFLLDFRRQHVQLMSLPAMSSLPPGLPIAEGGEAVAAYLLQHSIRYLAYGGQRTLRDLLTLTEARIAFSYPRSRTRWMMLRSHQRYREAVAELSGSRKRLYSDRSIILLDLSQLVTTIVPGERRADAHGFVDAVWTDGDTRLDNIDCQQCGGYLVLSTWGWYPMTSDCERLGVDVFADGRILTLQRTAGDRLVYRIPDGVDRVATLRIVSTTRPTTITGSRRSGPRVGIDLRAVEFFDQPALVDVPIQTVEAPPTNLVPFARRHHREKR